MGIKATFAMLAAFLVCMWSAAPAMAQKQKGHTGGLGESRIQLNLASTKNLVKAPGVTEKIAEAIIKYRQEKGPFKKPEDLLKVPGITKEVFTQINPQVGAEGDLFTLPRPGETLEEEDEDAPLSPSKC